MPKFLSQEWFNECLRLAGTQPERPGASARMQYVVEGPSESVRYYGVFEDGRLVSASLGELPDPDFTLTLSCEDSVGIHTGELDPNEAFKEGRIDFAGNMQKLMGVLPMLWPSATARRSSAAARYRAVQEQIRAMTEF